jgi:hypothetical protein
MQYLERAFSRMAVGSQDSDATVGDVSALIAQSLRDASSTEQLAAQPGVGYVVQAAGWLYPCFMPSSSLAPPVKAAAFWAWCSCMAFANKILYDYPVQDMAAFRLLLSPSRRPWVPGGSCS